MSHFSGRLKIVTVVPLEDEALEILKEYPNIDLHVMKDFPTKETLTEIVPGCVGLIVRRFPIDKDILDAAGPQLKVISSFAVGYDNIDLKECAARGIKVGYTKHLGADLVGEFCIGLMLNVSRRICESIHATRGKSWYTVHEHGGNAMNWFEGKSLINSTVGIFGLGLIGLETVKRLTGFGVEKIIYHNRKPNPKADELGCQYVSFERLLTDSDFLICSSSANPQNQAIFNIDAFKQMKPTSIFINVSRGSMVNTDDLYEALSNRIILGAGLDVTQPEPLSESHKLQSLENCIITPHIAWSEKNISIERSKCVLNHILWVLDGSDSERGEYIDLQDI